MNESIKSIPGIWMNNLENSLDLLVELLFFLKKHLQSMMFFPYGMSCLDMTVHTPLSEAIELVLDDFAPFLGVRSLEGF